jgi:hypothetical protein
LSKKLSLSKKVNVYFYEKMKKEKKNFNKIQEVLESNNKNKNKN